jgi:hypothetical protein
MAIAGSGGGDKGSVGGTKHGDGPERDRLLSLFWLYVACQQIGHLSCGCPALLSTIQLAVTTIFVLSAKYTGLLVVDDFMWRKVSAWRLRQVLFWKARIKPLHCANFAGQDLPPLRRAVYAECVGKHAEPLEK